MTGRPCRARRGVELDAAVRFARSAGLVPHESAHGHVTGQAVYLDDLPPFRNELLVEFVGSPLAHARIVALDVSRPPKIEGIAAVFTAADVPGDNRFGPIFHDEELLAAARMPSHRPADRRAGRRELARPSARPRAAVRLELERSAGGPVDR